MSPERVDLVLLAVGTLALIWLSRKSLRHPGRHGFYRFFVWEAILGLIVLNRQPWGEQPTSVHQSISWGLMLVSIYLVTRSYRALCRHGAASEARTDGTLYAFEKTTALVTSGIFRHIRHPMYASLLALIWGAYFQAPSWPGTALAGFASLLLVLTARADENECLAYFGAPYAAYMRRTRRFIPYLF
ncbi:MAG: isoprenylcysteine carboxylmethyltransferase family protein [Dechloromonas sp.]|nr:isoprenylcysteine carboxylmethyltransferase family protein [Candidatus Dechloromonas phosphoritropha]MBP6707518.1 isoprenylcysteine carboxylmethyltransferase family protein [Accumulibacter sp.]MBP8786613.1 isoprenylcysteine carboxylmethyltransferase family protein [Azonexus sp.]